MTLTVEPEHAAARESKGETANDANCPWKSRVSKTPTEVCCWMSQHSTDKAALKADSQASG